MTDIQEYTSDLQIDDFSVVDTSTLHPTQLCLGFREVQYRIGQFKEMSSEDLDSYLKENYLPVVIGPDKRPYVVDHHHRARAIELTDMRDTVYIKVLKNCCEWKERDFWLMMRENAWVYLFDKDGNPADTEEIPSSLEDLKDDKYRSLAWAVRKAGAYEKSDKPFQEFLWGDFFRQRIDFEDTEEGFQAAVNKAVELCKTHEAKHLPGFIKN
ncbi:putative ParB-like nuclease [Leptospira broomii serovar Hurstbridge str. 5399]|uniref:ParB-like nuclease n=1 Tax=Leptospira broomii serovar Hurstbridge str. 5399 TaxID=1049789 RepID=T0F8E1_9LEPT|nr:ParB/Srx family N-terminal domain-containing protein [Leptospira broomii]EQA44176.1 putative ParB-like nuclease [Leptospira broomii serovar Hurstbridge str. 5399]